MAEQNDLMLSEKELVPTDNLIFSIIGEKSDLWKIIMKHMADNYKDSAGEWNFYNDGKRWLFKMLWKKKTVFWIGILEDTFIITFWFPDRAQTEIEKSDLPNSVKEEFINARKYGSTRGLSITIADKSDVENVVRLISIKVRMK